MSVVEVELALRIERPTPTPSRLKMAAKSHVGRVRPTNQDSFALDLDAGRFALVADGMGGHKGGEVASSLVAKIVSQALQDPEARAPEHVEALAYRLFEVCNEALAELAQENPDLDSMGTTLTCAVLLDTHELLAIHAGDSRLYLLRDGHLKQLTRDHNVLAELLRAGMLTEDQAARNAHLSHMLTRVLCAAHRTLPELTRVHVQPGDRLLLCSDGLHGVVDDVVIERLVARDTSEKQICEALIDAALRGGAPDNVTAALLRVEA